MKAITKEIQDKITPAKAIELLKTGNSRFVNNLKINRNLLQQVNETRDGQHPFAVIISCMDSRAPAETIFDQGLGDILSIRIAGNIINDDIIGSAEFGCQIAQAKAVFVLGHTGCGAIRGTVENINLGHLNGILEKIKYSYFSKELQFKSLSLEDQLYKLTYRNVVNSIRELKTRSEILQKMEANGEIKIQGGVYDIRSGQVTFFSDIDIDHETRLN